MPPHLTLVLQNIKLCGPIVGTSNFNYQILANFWIRWKLSHMDSDYDESQRLSFSFKILYQNWEANNIYICGPNVVAIF